MVDIAALDLRVASDDDSEVANRIHAALTELNDAMDAAYDKGLVVKVDAPPALTYAIIGGRTRMAPPHLSVEIMRLLPRKPDDGETVCDGSLPTARIRPSELESQSEFDERVSASVRRLKARGAL